MFVTKFFDRLRKHLMQLFYISPQYTGGSDFTLQVTANYRDTYIDYVFQYMDFRLEIVLKKSQTKKFRFKP